MTSWFSWVIAIVLGVGLGLLMQRSQNSNKDRIHFLEKEDFFKNMRKGQLVDVRKQEEYDQDKIKGARHFKVNQTYGKYTKLRRDQSVFIYCNNGKKSYKAAKKMARDRFEVIYVLKDGFQ